MNLCKIGRLWVCLVLALSSVQGLTGDWELEEYIGKPGSSMQAQLAVSHNKPEIVTAEVNDEAVRKVLAGFSRFRQLQTVRDIQLTVTYEYERSKRDSDFLFSSPYTLKYPSLEARKKFPPRFQSALHDYLQIRSIGHTREFACASFVWRATNTAAVTPEVFALVRRYKEIPGPWLQPWEENGTQVGLYLLDGELAWTFRRMSANSHWGHVVDAQEFDPKLKPMFAAAGKKANNNLKAQGVKEGLGYCHNYWAELKRVLWAEHKIRWRCPTDLNEGLYD